MVSGGTVKPARAASSGACCPSAAMLTLSPQPNANSVSASACSAVRRWAPIRSNSASISSYTSVSTMQVCSAGQITDASKVLEIRMSTTAPARSALRWT